MPSNYSIYKKKYAYSIYMYKIICMYKIVLNKHYYFAATGYI